MGFGLIPDTYGSIATRPLVFLFRTAVAIVVTKISPSEKFDDEVTHW